MSCIKYKYIDESIANKSKEILNNKLSLLSSSSKANSINSNYSNNSNERKANSINSNEKKANSINSNEKKANSINSNEKKGDSNNEKKANNNNTKNEHKEIEIIKNELNQKHQHDNITRELKQEKRRLECEVNELKNKLVKYEKAKVSGTIDKSEITSLVECPLCGDIILNAAILSCSHGFCMTCIESYWRNDETNKVARLQRKVTKKGISTCPVCNDNVPPEPDKALDSSKMANANDKTISYEYLYHRSLHLDSICSLLYDDIDALKERERRSRDILSCYGVNVDKARTLKSHDDDEEMKVDDVEGDSKTDPLCNLCGNYHDPFVPCALNDETEDEEEDDDDVDDDGNEE